jgi:hypothetical protein
MDLPTTDPGSDFADFSSGDECDSEYEPEGHLTAVTKTTIMRVPKIRTEPFIRKSSSVSYEQHLMPPELIITKVLMIFLYLSNFLFESNQRTFAGFR